MNPFVKQEPRDSFGRWSSSGLDAHTQLRKKQAALDEQRAALIRDNNSKNLAWRQDNKMLMDRGRRTVVEKIKGKVLAGKWDTKEQGLSVKFDPKKNQAMLSALQAEQDRMLRQHHFEVHHPVRAALGQAKEGIRALALKAVSRKHRTT